MKSIDDENRKHADASIRIKQKKKRKDEYKYSSLWGGFP